MHRSGGDVIGEEQLVAVDGEPHRADAGVQLVNATPSGHGHRRAAVGVGLVHLIVLRPVELGAVDDDVLALSDTGRDDVARTMLRE